MCGSRSRSSSRSIQWTPMPSSPCQMRFFSRTSRSSSSRATFITPPSRYSGSTPASLSSRVSGGNISRLRIAKLEVGLDGVIDVPDRPHDAGGGARRARRKPVLLEDRAGDAAFGELVGNGASDNSTADDGNIGRSRHLSALRETMPDSIRRRARLCKGLFRRFDETGRPEASSCLSRRQAVARGCRSKWPAVPRPTGRSDGGCRAWGPSASRGSGSRT